MTSTDNFSTRVEALKRAIDEADHIIIGAGSGLSTAAGLDYAGDAFRSEFAPWIERYGFTDLYTSSFYSFASKEEYWAYWAKHIWFCRYRSGAMSLYPKSVDRHDVNSILCINTMFYNVIFLMTVIRIIEMQPVDYLSLAACVIHFHSSNDRFGFIGCCDSSFPMLSSLPLMSMPSSSWRGSQWVIFLPHKAITAYSNPPQVALN